MSLQQPDRIAVPPSELGDWIYSRDVNGMRSGGGGASATSGDGGEDAGDERR